MTRTGFDVVIVGAGHAGAQAAIALRQRGYTGSITIIGDEPERPYERPPLSKDYLAGEKPFERILLRPATFWEDRSIAMLLGRSVVRVNPDDHCVELDDGSTLVYGTLIWAAGGKARTLACEGRDLAGVHSVRNKADVDRIIAELPDVTTVCVIGGGYVGLEAAAVLSKLGKRVVIVEALDRVLSRVAGEALSRFYEAEHRAHGVKIRLSGFVAHLAGESRVSGVVLSDGEIIACDMVIVGIGIVPSVEPLIAAGAVGGNGVRVDHFGRTSLVDIYAIGDCALHANGFADGGTIRLESVQNANDMATTVAKAITGAPEPYEAVPWFWSNQYDLRLQTVGLSAGHDEIVIRGTPESRSFSIMYLKQGRVIALDCVNATKDYVQGRLLVVTRAIIPVEQLAAVPTLKQLLAEANASSTRAADAKTTGN